MELDIQAEELLTWNAKKLWNTLQIVKNEEESEIDQEEYAKVEEGIRIKVPIWYLTEEWYSIYPSGESVIIKKYGKFKLKDFMKEKEEREKLMRELILDNIEEKEIVTARS